MSIGQKIILASGSKYRRQQLEDLGWDFQVVAPEIDENHFKSKISDPHELVKVLSEEKAKVVAADFPKAIVVGSDQIALFEGKILGKPLSQEKALHQLETMAGHWHSLITGVSVIISGEVHYDFVETRVLMKKLSQPSLRAYVKQDNPIDCAGAYKFEKGGPLLMERVETRDPSSIIGLPLIALTNIIFKQTGEITT